jgi:putative ABC transport system permease protein
VSFVPPRLTDTLLRWLLPPEKSEIVIGDIYEEGARYASTRGRRFARRWCWGQTLAELWSLRPLIRQKLFFELESTPADIRHGLRVFANRPLFASGVVATLALACGLNITVFSAVYGVLLRPLPFRHPEQLTSVGELHASVPESRVASYRSFAEWRDRTSAFSGLTATRPGEFTIDTGGEPERVGGTRVTANFFQVMDVDPLFGRAFIPDDDRPKNAPVVVISESLWRNRLQSDPHIVGRSIRVDGERRTVVGVMPSLEQLPGLGWSDLWVPIGLDDVLARSDSSRWLLVTGRLKPGLPAATAEAQVRSVERRLALEFPDSHQGWDSRVRSLSEVVTGKVRTSLFVLLGASMAVLLIACVNLAGLLMTHAREQSGELAMRVALGASRGRIMRQLSIQFLLMVVFGSLAGVGIAFKSMPLLVSIVPPDIPRLDAIQVDRHALSFAFALLILTGGSFVLGPAVWGTTAGFEKSLRSGGRGLIGPTRQSAAVRRVLAVGQLATITTLLVASMLFVRSFVRLQRADPGFDKDHVIALDIALPAAQYSGAAHQRVFFQDLIQRIQAMSGIDAAAVVRFGPLGNGKGRTEVAVAGHAYSPGSEPLINYNVIAGDYFRALAIPMKSGRMFSDSEVWRGGPVVILSASAAHRFWPSGRAVGEHVRIGATGEVCEVVGVVGDVNRERLDSPPEPEVYLPLARLATPSLQLVARTKMEPSLMAADVRQAVRSVDSTVPTEKVTTAGDIVAQALAGHRFRTSAMSGFAAVGLALAVVGIYCVMAHSVGLRRREFSVRMALGASRRNIIGSVLVEGLTVGGTGVAAGLALGLLVSWLLRSILFESPAFDPLVFSGVGGLLIAVTGAACAIPAFRAARSDIRSLIQTS